MDEQNKNEIQYVHRLENMVANMINEGEKMDNERMRK